MAARKLEPSSFAVSSGEIELRGEEVGEGPPVVLLHGLTANRRYVLHGSVALARRGHRLISYDARGHGSSDPAPPGDGYSYRELAGDLHEVITAKAGAGTPVLAGHSMGAHTAVALALTGGIELSGLVLICPASLGEPLPDEILAEWDGWADGLEQGGVEGFLDVYTADLDLGGEWRETVVRITRDRLGSHEHPEAVARALREVPRSTPFEGLAALERLQLPTLVVASRDDADPAHPYAVAEAWAERIPGATLTSEDEGEPPLAWRGGQLSRGIADFLDREVSDREA